MTVHSAIQSAQLASPPHRAQECANPLIERAMRHTSPETKRIYQLSMVEQVPQAMEKANQRVYGGRVTVH